MESSTPKRAWTTEEWEGVGPERVVAAISGLRGMPHLWILMRTCTMVCVRGYV